MTELIGVTEIAELAGVTSAAVANWRKRFVDFPRPVHEVGSGPAFDQDAVLEWLESKNKPIKPLGFEDVLWKAADKKGVVTLQKLSSYVTSEVTDRVQEEFGADVYQQPAFKGELEGPVPLVTPSSTLHSPSTRHGGAGDGSTELQPASASESASATKRRPAFRRMHRGMDRGRSGDSIAFTLTIDPS